MRKLLSANLRYMLWNRIAWIELAFCAIFSGWIMFANYSPEIQASENALPLESPFFIFYQIIGIVLASAISLIVGTEYSDGAIRNKLTVGHTRTEIYFSILITNIALSAVVIALHGIISFAIGYFLFGGFTISASKLILALICALLANLVFTTLFVAIALNCSSKAVSGVVSILVVIAVIMVSNIVGNKLIEPEMTYDGITITANGIQYGEMIKNPSYVSGTARAVCEFIYDLLPSGQLIQLQQLEFGNMGYRILLSALLFAMITLVGYLLFGKKDIK